MTVPVDVEGYNAIGIPAIPGAVNSDSTSWCSVETSAAAVTNAGKSVFQRCGLPGWKLRQRGRVQRVSEYPILDHFFDGANDPITGQQVTTDLTLVPCSEDFSDPDAGHDHRPILWSSMSSSSGFPPAGR